MTSIIQSKRDRTVEFYNLYSDEYFNKSVDADMTALYSEFLKWLPCEGSILDAGCGSGRDTKYFLSAGYRVAAIDASEKMVELSSRHTGQETMLLDFRDLTFEDEFDGIWSIASLIHIPKKEIDFVVTQFTRALKSQGIWCTSFKEGTSERNVNGRLFNDYTQETFRELIGNHPDLRIEKIWATQDYLGRNHRWTTAILRKVNPC